MNDKRNHKELEELSAYLDGEATRPRDVERRIDNDADAALIAKELSALSTELGRLPAPDIHPAFRTRVMAHVRETDREPAPPLISWRWRSFAAMVVLAPFAAAIWTFWWAPPAVPEADSQRALVKYLFEQDDEVVLDQLASLLADDVDAVNGDWTIASDASALEAVNESEWLDVLAMDSSFVALDSAWSGDDWSNLSDEEVRELERLLLDEPMEDATI